MVTNRIQQSQVCIFEQNPGQMEMSDGPTRPRSRQKAAPGAEMSRTARRVPFLTWRSFISNRFGDVFLLLGWMGFFGTGLRLGAVLSAFLLGSFVSEVLRAILAFFYVHRESLWLSRGRLGWCEGSDGTEYVNELVEGLRPRSRRTSIQLVVWWSWGRKWRGLGDEEMACRRAGSCVLRSDREATMTSRDWPK